MPEKNRIEPIPTIQDALTKPALSAAAFRLFVELVLNHADARTGAAMVTRAQLAATTSPPLSARSVRRLLTELEAAQLVKPMQWKAAKSTFLNRSALRVMAPPPKASQ